MKYYTEPAVREDGTKYTRYAIDDGNGIKEVTGEEWGGRRLADETSASKTGFLTMGQRVSNLLTGVADGLGLDMPDPEPLSYAKDKHPVAAAVGDTLPYLPAVAGTMATGGLLGGATAIGAGMLGAGALADEGDAMRDALLVGAPAFRYGMGSRLGGTIATKLSGKAVDRGRKKISKSMKKDMERQKEAAMQDEWEANMIKSGNKPGVSQKKAQYASKVKVKKQQDITKGRVDTQKWIDRLDKTAKVGAKVGDVTERGVRGAWMAAPAAVEPMVGLLDRE